MPSMKFLPELKMQDPISWDKEENETSLFLIVSQYPAKIVWRDWK